MAEIRVLVRAEQGLAVLHRAEAATAADDGSGRTRDQRRADWVIGRLLTEPGRAGEPGTADEPRTAGDLRPAEEQGTAGEQGTAAEAAGAGTTGRGSRADAAHVDPVTGTSLVLDDKRRRPVQVLVHVPVATALGLSDEPGTLDGLGPIDADHCRELLTVAELRKVCVDAVSGEVLHVEDCVRRPVADAARAAELRRQGLSGAQARAQAQAEAVREALLDHVQRPSIVPTSAEEGYRPSARLSRTVKVRQPRCDFPTCRAPARLCDDEHTVAWPRGDTSLANLATRSRWCHRLKQAGWRPTPLPDGSTVWVSPSGRQYLSPAQHEPPPTLEPGTRLPPPVPTPVDDTGPPGRRPARRRGPRQS
jgi:hypothetical protein